MPSRGNHHLNLLYSGLESDDPLVQADAARLLGELGDGQAVSPILKYVKTSQHNFKTAGLEALARIGERSVAAELRPLVGEPNVSDDWYWFSRRTVQASVAVALLRLGDQSGAGFLKDLAKAGDLVFYSWLAPSVLRLPDETAAARDLKKYITVPSLCGDSGLVSRTSDPAQITMVAESLGLLGGTKACAKLLGLLEFRSRYVRGQAAMSLLAVDARLGHRQAVDRLFRKDPTNFTRIKAALALHQAGIKAGKEEYLTKAGSSLADYFDRSVAIEALGILGSPGQAPVARRALAHAHPFVRLVAIEALERIGGKEADRGVGRMLRDQDLRVRQQAAKYFLVRERSGKS